MHVFKTMTLFCTPYRRAVSRQGIPDLAQMSSTGSSGSSPQYRPRLFPYWYQQALSTEDSVSIVTLYGVHTEYSECVVHSIMSDVYIFLDIMHKEHIRVQYFVRTPYSVLRAEIESSPTERTQRSPSLSCERRAYQRQRGRGLAVCRWRGASEQEEFGDFQRPPSSPVSMVGPRHSVLRTRGLSKSQMN